MPATASFDIQTNPLEMESGQEFTISIFVDSGFQPVNTIFARISYPQEKLSFINSSFSGSDFSSVVERRDEAGVIKLASFTTKPYSGTHGKFVNLEFHPIVQKESQISIQPVSKIHASDGMGTNIADPSQLPVSLTVFPGTKQKSILVKGNAVEEMTLQSSPGPVSFPEQGVADYSTFSSYPNKYQPSQKSRKAFDLSDSSLIIIAAMIFLTIVFLLIIIKIRKKKLL